MSDIIKNIDLFEGLGERFIDIKVYCNTREESLDFEDTLHKNGWTWSGRQTYLIRDDSSITNVIFSSFNKFEKLFSGRIGYERGNNILDYTFNKKDILNKILDKKPSYEPRKIERTLEAFKLDETPYDVIGFLIGSMDDVKRIVDVFYDVHGVENYTPKEKIISEFRDYYENDFRNALVVVNKIRNSFDASDVQNFSHEFKNYDPKIYKVAELVMFGLKPSYKPKKIERTLEAFIFAKSDYDAVMFRVNDVDEIRRIVDVFHSIHGVEKNNSKERIVSELKEYYDGVFGLLLVSKKRNFFFGVRENDREYELQHDYRNTDPMVYTINDLNLFRTPSYEPKKIVRTLEAVKYYPYRFKTEQEFIDAFGENWKNDIIDRGPNWADEMNHLFGKDFPFEEDELNSKDDEYPIDDRWNDPKCEYDDGWMISWDMLIKNSPRVPNYNPRKIDRTLESVSGNDFEKRYNRYKKELDDHNFLYVRTNNNKEIDDFYLILKKHKNIKFDSSIEYNINEWKRNPNENDCFYFSFLPNNLGGFDIGYFTYNKRGPQQYPQWMMDMSDREIIRMLFNINIAPSYEPKNFKRTLESFINEEFENKYNHDIIIVKVDTPEDSEKIQNLIFKYDIRWGSGHNTPIYLNGYFPEYLVISLGSFFGTPCITHTNSPLFDYLDGSNPDDNIYTINDYEKIRNILEYGKPVIRPSYLPKKIYREI